MVPAMSYDTFADAILKKLITEIAGLRSRALGIGEAPGCLKAMARL
jgi:hypothetical protein